MAADAAEDIARRAYWTEQLEQGYDLVRRIVEYEVVECGESFASLTEAVRSAGVDIRFSTTRLAGVLDRVYWIRRSLVEDVLAIGREMNQRGWVLQIEDGYRSLDMQKRLGSMPELFDTILRKCIWECGGRIPSPEMVFRRCSVLVAIVPKAGTHMSGSAIDISVFRKDDGTEVWRGNPYLEMSERTPMRSPFVESDAIRNRLAITEIMEAHGFMHFPFEFWHYNKGDALAHLLTGQPGPARFGPVHWDPATNTVTPVANPTQPLRPPEEIRNEIAAAIRRAESRGTGAG